MSGEVNKLLLERFRQYLHLLARNHLADRYRGKIDASDIVQQTMMEAYRSRDRFHGESDAELAGWLRKILACNLSEAVRGLGRAKRDLAKEEYLEDASFGLLQRCLAADQSSPSYQLQRSELVLQLAEALAELPEAQREALVLRYCQGKSLDEISETLGRTAAAVAGLLQRGSRQLRELMNRKTERRRDGT